LSTFSENYYRSDVDNFIDVKRIKWQELERYITEALLTLVPGPGNSLTG
jgi:hypothetical protein